MEPSILKGGRGTQPRKAVYLIDSLNSGGAQRQLVELVKGLDPLRVKASVVTYYNIPFFMGELEKANIPCYCIPKRDKLGVSFIHDFVKFLRKAQPDFIHSFLNVPNLYARMAKLAGAVSTTVTSERNTSLTQRLDLTVAEKLSWRLSDVIIVNANGIKELLVDKIGVDQGKIRVVYNGVRADRFDRPNPQHVARIRRACGAESQNTVLFGLVGRVAPQKNHLGLVRALQRVISLRPDFDIRLAFWGAPTDRTYAELVKRTAEELNIDKLIFFFGVDDDMASVYAACDVVVLPSLWEGLPNIVLEGMVAGRVVAASDIVDNRRIITDGVDGFLMAPDSIDSLTDVIIKVVSLPEEDRREIVRQARAKILKSFSVSYMVENTMRVYEELGLC
jgi:glycosyltransferase involved in cell wall biosynthesis